MGIEPRFPQSPSPQPVLIELARHNYTHSFIDHLMMLCVAQYMEWDWPNRGETGKCHEKKMVYTSDIPAPPPPPHTHTHTRSKILGAHLLPVNVLYLHMQSSTSKKARVQFCKLNTQMRKTAAKNTTAVVGKY